MTLALKFNKFNFLITLSSPMKNYACEYPGCGKSFTRSEHLRRHALNHEQPRNGLTCERCSVHFRRPDLLGKVELVPKLILLLNTNRLSPTHDAP